ncbi:MAG: shikimate dehydrogenase [Candidatus Omnitrophica bacterium]|nr:shikimate dehydrogenase [Candidatus Omnitrophota bacterium]
MADKFWKLGIVGWPLGYSLSPRMHQAALKMAGFSGEYREYKVPVDQLEVWLNREGLKLDGFNVTMPYKNAVWKWLKNRPGGSLDRFVLDSELDVVNTVAVRDGRPIGYNTDGDGFLRPMIDPPRFFTLAGWKAILIGSGGSAKAIGTVLALKTKLLHLAIWNRPAHLDRARELADRLNRLRGSGAFASATAEWSELPMEESQLLINTTPMGMKGSAEMPGELLKGVHHGQLVYDIVYEPRETFLIRTARERGCPVLTGEEMLSGQGAASFEIWTGKGGMMPVMKEELDGYYSAVG